MFALNNIRSDDNRTLTRAAAYLADNPDPGVRPRPPNEVQRALETGQGLVLTNGDENSDEICGVSLIYQYDSPPGPVYSEIGTMRITANGYDLQAFMAKLHLVQIALEEPGEIRPVFAVVSPKTASEHNLRDKVGMGAWRPPPDLVVLRQAAGVPFVANKPILSSSPEALEKAGTDLRRWHKNGRIFQTPKNGGLIRIDMKWFDPVVLGQI